MFFIEDGVIYLTRGDYAELEVAITDGDGKPYTLAEGDVLTLSVREAPDDEAKLQFSVSSATDRIIINNADTAEMEPGEYSADIQLTTADGKRRTIWAHTSDDPRRRGRTGNWKNFILMPEVTMQ